MSQIFPGFNKLQIACRLLTYSVVVALPLTFNIGVLAQPSTFPNSSVSQSTDTSQDPIGQKLFGQWEIQDTSLPTKINLLFTPEGNFFLILGQAGRSGAYPLKYRINSTPKPMHLDVILPDTKEPVETIFDFTADGQLRLQLNNTDPGKPRPKNFGADVSVFKKISDSTTLPENVEVVPTEEKKTSVPESEARNYIGTMNRANQAYYLEYGKFARTLNELQIGIKPETENYRYRIIPQGNSKGSVVSTATAKKPGLKSYTGFVYVKKVKGEDLTYAIVCETNQASTKAPVVPKIPRNPNQEAICPAGSTSLTR
ncbi:MAG TPA: type IV pilin-like G/H family protein [Nostocaceae cyanobacterium]|nr:type IV pilin-like G/H family protein [Nostocaceae cyanobacterium]